MCVVERRQAGIGTGESITVRIGDGEGIGAGLVGTGITGKQSSEINGTVIDENAFRGLGVADRVSVIDGVISIVPGSRSRHVIRGIGISRRVESGTLVFAAHESYGGRDIRRMHT